ncbi:MAG: glycosyltransferase [Euryarchaeota archaeon]|nr:glycosyltransferase [Euryarchaeota archaeon]MDE1836405.1 glycosyltransferase [Euryarchaeota archaeon]MDE1879080.1 glycosyltransferase [Euryarchaeota archaeon]MDE2044153.1 glycosyltransferase [Thermoplasmata archaeon]
MEGPTGSSPYLSVIVVARIRREFLEECIGSIVNSSLDRSHYEVILVWAFDAPEWEARFRALGVQVLRRPPEMRVGALLMEALRIARGEVMVFMEDDDAFYPEKLQHIEEEFRSHPKLGFFHHDQLAVDARGKTLGWIHAVEGFNLSSIAVRRSFLRPFDDILRRTVICCDRLLYFVARLAGTGMVHEGRLLTRYRLHQGNVHVGLDPTNDYGRMVEAARTELRAGRPVHRLAYYMLLTYLVLYGTRALLGHARAVRLFRLYSTMLWRREVRRVLEEEPRRTHPDGTSLIVTV